MNDAFVVVDDTNNSIEEEYSKYVKLKHAKIQLSKFHHIGHTRQDRLLKSKTKLRCRSHSPKYEGDEVVDFLHFKKRSERSYSPFVLNLIVLKFNINYDNLY